MEVLQTALIAAGLVLPGWGWARRWDEGLLVAMLGSWVSLFAWTLLTTVLPISLSLGYLLAGQIITGLAGWVWARKDKVAMRVPKLSGPLGVGWLVLPLVLVAGWKAVFQPLSGVDADFRWNHLAEMMIKHGGLEFYPPTSAEDFAVYFWADGIPPLISTLYAWSYLVAGETDRGWTAVPVLLQWLALLLVVRRLGTLWGGVDGANWALLLAGSTFLLQFAINLGQETGCTAIGVGLMILGLAQAGPEKPSRAGWLAGLGAAVLAASREYGVLIAGVGFISHVMIQWRGHRDWSALQGWLLLLVPAWWFLRTWIRSGNPWLSLSMGGVFPVNPIFHEWIGGYKALYGGALSSFAGWQEIGRLLLMTAAPATLGWIVGAILFRKRAGWTVAMAVSAATVLCWLLSVAYTAGGVFYSMRVLSPILVLGCAWGGALIAKKLTTPTARALVAGMLGLVTVDATARSLTAPVNPWTTALTDWPAVGYTWQTDFWPEQERFIDAAVASLTGRFVGDASGLQRFFAKHDREFVPWWSPEVRALFDDAAESDPVDTLRSRGITYLVFHRTDFTHDFLQRTGVLARLDGRIHGVMANDVFVIFELLPADQ